ncbi:MAG: type IV secretory system conjugative DNA transfer family protein [Deltaproteobacteria bacterium]|nr:type IV secretory system conjugative DNA transfer family protein [Deltaproteobacteria bacterium]
MRQRKALLIAALVAVAVVIVAGIYIVYYKQITAISSSSHLTNFKDLLGKRILKGIVIGLIAAIAIAVIVLKSTSNSLKKNKSSAGRPNRSRSNELGSGDLARLEHVRRWITKTGEQDTCLYVSDLKGADGILLKKGQLVIPREERNRHVLIIAKTGGGKTSKLILPVLYNDCMCPVRSTIVLDSKPEMWSKLAGMTAKYNPQKKILLFNPLDKLRSLSWNILAKVEDDTDAKLIANTLMMATDNPNSKADTPFFRNNALQLLNAMMVGLLRDPNERLSMPRVHELTHCGIKNLCDWLEARPEAIRNTRTFVELARNGSQNADTIMSELGMRLAAWDLSAIRSTTFMDELNLEDLIQHPSLFIIELRESELEMLRPMANVLVIEVLRFLTKRAEQMPKQTLPRPVGLVIDEFASALGRLPDIHVKLNTLRSRNVSIVAAIQSIAQIKSNYDKEADPVLAGFNTKILMPALDFQDSEWASKETGTMTVRFNVGSQGHNRRIIDTFASKNTGLQEQVQQRAVLTPDEIGRPVDNAATFFMPNTPVFQGHLIPFYKIPEMSKHLATSEQEGEFSLRQQPLESVDNDSAHESPLTTPDAAGKDDERTTSTNTAEIRSELESVKKKIGWSTTSTAAKDWWKSFEEANGDNLNMVLTLTKELQNREVKINDFFDALVKSGKNKIPEILAHMDARLLNSLKERVGWARASSSARQWWETFEKANESNVIPIIKLCRDLHKRDATIEEFFDTYASINTSSIDDVLLHIDVKRDEEEAERRRRAKNREREREVEPKRERPSDETREEQANRSISRDKDDIVDDWQTFADDEDTVLESDNGSERENFGEEEDNNIADDVDDGINGNYSMNSSTLSEEAETEDTDISSLSDYIEEDAYHNNAAMDEAIDQARFEEEDNEQTENRAEHLFAGEAAAKKLHLASYFEMGEHFLKQGLEKDFTALITMAKEDSLISKEDLEHLINLGTNYGLPKAS